jgi:hypothetical protein
LDLKTVVVDWKSAVRARAHLVPRRSTANGPLAEEPQSVLALDSEFALQPHGLRFLKSRRHCALSNVQRWRIISGGMTKCGARGLERYRNLASDHMQAEFGFEPEIGLQLHQLGGQEFGKAPATRA